MSVIGIVNSDPEIKSLIESIFRKTNDGHNLIFLDKEEEIIEFLNYTMPELMIFNLSDPKINIAGIVDYIKNDKWVLNFGIIGIFSHEKDNEEDLLKKYKTVNILNLLENYRLETHLVKSIQIIEQNYQIIFQHEFSKNLLEGAAGSFIIENDLLAVPLYSGISVTILSQRGLISPDKKMRLQLSLAELIVNAIEHGNCGITYEEKNKALKAGISHVDLIAEKYKDPAVRSKKVTFSWEIKTDKTIFIIQDEGDGFNVRAFLEKLKTQDKQSQHGRGILMAAGLGNKLKYNDKGNKAALIITHDSSVEYEAPAGFSKEQIILVNKGDVIIKEGDPSDNLYYISSGTYDVLHNNKPVGTLSPQDIFMGEMSFLLNQRRSATIKATSSGKLILITQKNFVNVIREYPHYGIFLSKLLAKRIVRSNKQTAEHLAPVFFDLSESFDIP